MKYRLLAFLAFVSPFFSFAQEKGLDQQIDEAFKPVSDFFSSVIFFEIAGTPFVLFLLVASAAFFTIYFGFPNIRFFGMAIRTVRGKFEDIEKHGAKELYGEDGIAQGQDLTKVDIEEHIESIEVDGDLAIDGDIVDTLKTKVKPER